MLYLLDQVGTKARIVMPTEINNQYIRMDKDGKITGVTHVTYIRRKK